MSALLTTRSQGRVARLLDRLSASVQARLTAGASAGPDGPGDQEAREAGMTTAEYAMGTVAACGFSGVLYKLITSDLVMGLLKAAISRAFRIAF